MLKVPLHTRRGAPRSRASGALTMKTPATHDWEARNLPRGRAVLDWMGAAPCAERSAIEGYFVENNVAATKEVDRGPRVDSTLSECLPEPDLVYEGPPAPTGWDEWNASLDDLVQRIERYRKTAHETRRRANQGLESIRARLDTGWRFAEAFAERLRLVSAAKPGRTQTPRAKSTPYKH